MLTTVRTFITHYPILSLALAGLWSAMSVDVLAFLKWKSWDDAHSFDWRLALLRYLQGAIGNAVGTLLVSGAGAAAGALAVVGLVVAGGRRSSRTAPILLVLVVGLTASSCASAAHRHPYVSKELLPATYALDMLTVAESASDTLKSQVAAGVWTSAQAAPHIRILGQIGGAAHDVGELVKVYNAAKGEIERGLAKHQLLDKLAVLTQLVASLPRDKIAEPVSDLQGLVDELGKALRALKG